MLFDEGTRRELLSEAGREGEASVPSRERVASFDLPRAGVGPRTPQAPRVCRPLTKPRQRVACVEKHSSLAVHRRPAARLERRWTRTPPVHLSNLPAWAPDDSMNTNRE